MLVFSKFVKRYRKNKPEYKNILLVFKILLNYLLAKMSENIPFLEFKTIYERDYTHLKYKFVSLAITNLFRGISY